MSPQTPAYKVSTRIILTIPSLVAILCSPLGLAPAPAQNKPAVQLRAEPATPNQKQAKLLSESAKKCNQILESEEALKLANQAIALDPKQFGAYIERALAHISLGQTDQALADFSIAASGGDRKSEKAARREKADLLYRLKRYNESINELTTIEKKYGSLSDGMLYRRSHAYMAIGKPNMAVIDLTTAIKGEPNSSRLFEARMLAYVALKEWDNALADCNKCISLSNVDDETMGNRSDLLKRRATIYDKLGKADLAKKDLEVAKRTENANYQNAPFRTDKKRTLNTKTP